MLEYDWENSVGYWICAASHAMRKALDARLAVEGITIRQWEVLAWLSVRRSGSQSEIADQLGIEPHTLGGVLKRMESAGLLERRPCEEDRRKITIHPTPQAKELWQRVVLIFEDNRQQATQELSEEQLETLKAMLSKIFHNLKVLDPEAPELAPRPHTEPYIESDDSSDDFCL